MNVFRQHQHVYRFGIVAMMALAFTLVFSPFAKAQTPETGSDEVVRTVSVEGTGIVQIAPDTASISLGVVANEESLADAQKNVSDGLAATTSALTEAGILPEDISTTSYNVSPIAEYDRDGNYVGIERYEVSSGLTVVVRDIESVGTILDMAVTAGANNVWGISFYLEEPAEAASQARQAAVDDARGKADELATASGSVVVGVISINETSSPAPAPLDYTFARGAADADMAEASSVPMSPGQTTVTVSVSIVFEIAPAAG